MKKSTISIIVAAVISTTSLNVSAENTWKDGAKDAWIDGKAESTLLFNGNLNSFDINTDVKNGTVILTGKVNNSVDKALAEELVASLEGVEKVDNKLTVIDSKSEKDTKMMQSLKDSKIETVVKTRLLFESQVSGLDIEVEVKNGEVTLSGKVESDSERDLAVAIAKNTDDVTNVVDKLKS
ncbi:BON domain-containing protein [Thalassotalea sp. 1_MG-2023]|uniref:BON domain-containing protein n=1 Tax=Thalassotalea sp. 1_MG-2023 TaxID=3062680 RepID=UPI0026E3FF4C|nr:BON domain-containing protein [Thalassotalea sp. 1_MG-2023]MDO6427696.1 BON domain-containing protein [Thalassotalea sp. 1_MG-2023]